MIGVLNYGLANLRSVQRAFERIGHEAKLITRGDEVDAIDRLVLPGVGAVADALTNLRRENLDAAVLRHVRRARPFLGICLGLQMLCDVCLEGGEHRGLGVIGGRCERLAVDRTHALKVPHMGWNTLARPRDTTLLLDLPADAMVYFVHSYHVTNIDPDWVACTSEYGVPIVSGICRDNIAATQFHPEKSQRAGEIILRAFVEKM